MGAPQETLSGSQEVLPPCDLPGSLVSRTRELLRRDHRSLIDIHTASNIPFYWLKSFYRGEATGPNANRVQYLYEFLTGTRLEV